MSWFQKPNIPDQIVLPGLCMLCGEKGAIQISGPIVSAAATAEGATKWICRACADIRGKASALN
jgi:hypothetical protein